MPLPDSDRSRSSLFRRISTLLLLGAAGLGTATAVTGQASAGMAEPTETEEGIPVTDGLTREKCGACHVADAKGNLSRISWIRTTPEGWDQAIKRMVKLNGADVSPEDARHIVRYLSNSHGLAPEEAKPVMYLTEKRLVDETTIPSESVRQGCAACHAFAQPLSWRRSSLEWKNLQDFHIALYSQADAQYRKVATDEPGATIGEPRPVVNKPGALALTDGQVALDYIRKVAPLRTPEWMAWSSRIQAPHLAGKWLVSASLPGKGRFVGTMTVSPGGADDEFTTATALRSLADGTAISSTGNGIVYSGYSWRGRTATGAAPAGPDSLDQPMRETMWFAPDRKSATGRWFWGEYQEFGFDVTLTRAEGGPTIGAISPAAIKAGSKGTQLHIYGDALPASPSSRDIDLGTGLAVTRVVSASPTELVVTVDAATTAAPGAHDVSVGPAVLAAALPVYRKVDYIKVTPETAVARLGGARHPAGFSQFDAVGFDVGADGKPGTADDVRIGVIPADFSVEEFQATWYDDDKGYVGKLSKAGFFTPNLDGPNPQRSANRNNYGDIWVVATARDEKDSLGKPLTAKAYLVVTVPSFKRWDNPELSK
ncbi:MAG: quinohemoprotein amine dehydrogenase subunit alpha [Pseudomonadota bacterium]|jgi:quinohemoprotein amine dehydrogenase